MHSDPNDGSSPRRTKARKGRLVAVLLATLVATGTAVTEGGGSASAATSSPTARCESWPVYHQNGGYWYQDRGVYFHPNIKVEWFMDGKYYSERVEYRAWLTRWDGSNWRYYKNSAGSYLSVDGSVDFQSGDFPRAVSPNHSGHYRWYVEYWYYPIGSNTPQHFEGWSNNYCYLK